MDNQREVNFLKGEVRRLKIKLKKKNITIKKLKEKLSKTIINLEKHNKDGNNN